LQGLPIFLNHLSLRLSCRVLGGTELRCRRKQFLSRVTATVFISRRSQLGDLHLVPSCFHALIQRFHLQAIFAGYLGDEKDASLAAVATRTLSKLQAFRPIDLNGDDDSYLIDDRVQILTGSQRDAV